MKSNRHYRPLRDHQKVLSILGEISLFGGLNQALMSRLLSLLKEVSYQPGEAVFEQGQEPSHIYVISRGTVKIMARGSRGKPLELVRFTTGACFGETSAIGIQPHSATAVAVTEVQLIVLEREALLSIFESDKELFGLLVMNIAREACRRLHMADETILHYALSKTGKGK